jgi:ribosomal subunit interface protein
MELPLQITFRDIPPSDAVAASIRERVQKLERFCDCIMSCRIVVQEPHRRHQQGSLFSVTIDLTVPGAELAVGGSGSTGDDHAHENMYVALRDAFAAMQRKLQAYMHQRRHDNRVHEAQPRARVTRIFPQDGYGFITTPDGREIYFHTNAVLGGRWEEMEVGTEVRFAEEPGDNGPQASTVECLRRGVA